MEFRYLLRKFRERSGIDKTSLARKLGMKNGNYLVNIESGNQRPPTLDRCKQIAEALSLNKEETEYLINAAAEERVSGEELEIIKGAKSNLKIIPKSGKTIRIPIIGMACAGAALPMVPVEEYFEIDAAFVPSSDVVGIKMVGDCLLDRGIKSGDLVFISKDAPIKDGDIAVVSIDNDVTCKVVRHIPGNTPMLILEAANKNDSWRMVVNPKESKIVFIGKVVFHFSRH